MIVADIFKLRVLYFGMSGLLSRIPLAQLLQAGVNICGIVLPTSVLPPYLHPENGRFQTNIPQANNNILLTSHPDPLQLAAQYQIPITAVSNLRHPEILDEIAHYQPDLIIVSCFDQKFPQALLDIPRLGCLNLHPSLLPQFRGPSPLFWTFQQGVQQTGVTLHWMNADLDTGDIFAQTAQTLPDGISSNEAEILMANKGANLLLNAMQKLVHNEMQKEPQSGTPSYFPVPTTENFKLDLQWSAQRAFNFIRGTAEWQRPYFLDLNGEEVWLKTAVSYHPNKQQTTPIQQQGTHLSIQFIDGILLATTT